MYRVGEALMGREINEALIEQVLADLKIEFFRHGTRLQMCCPFHDDRDPSAAFYLDSKLFHCYAEEITTDLVGFYAKVTEQDRRGALRDMEKRYGEFGERQKRCNRHLLNTLWNRGEKRLKELKDLGAESHAKVAELLDLVMVSYERGKIDEEELDRLFKMWYNKAQALKGGTGNAGIRGVGAAEASSNAGIEEGLDDILRLRRQGSQPALGSTPADDSVDMD